MPIRVLPAAVAARIAAGEVVERPASVVKELIENALDAGATRITVQVERGGLGLIRVVDDGRGIPAAELPLAVERHATSKLDADADLAHITTLGFRGEALPSIAAAADVEITSRTSATEAGFVVRVREGVAAAVRPAPAAPGTSVSVRELFARQPARRKFLRTPAAEAAQIALVISHYALAYPEVSFALTNDGRRTLLTSGSRDPREAATAIYGVATTAQPIDLSHDGGGMLVRGLISPPELTRSNRSSISVFVNRRWVQHRRLVFAVASAYDTLLMTGRHPLAVIDITIDPVEVDVNVHPTKAEVRFRAEGEVFRTVQAAVRQTLLRLGVRPSLAGAGSGAAGASWWSAPATSDTSSVAEPWWTPPPGSLPEPIAAPAAAGPPRMLLPVLRVVGQIGSTYVIAEGPEGMYLIDQHAAHERVTYERIVRARAERGPDVQALLDPLTFDPTPAQAAAVAECGAELAALGFAIEPFGDRSLVLRAVPAPLAGRDAVRAVTEFLDALLAETAGVDRAERAAMTLACHAAIRAGKVLSLEEMRALVQQLERCASPRTCPHGRPTMVHVSANALEREFGRR